MGRQLKPYIERLTRTLQDNGIYNERNDSLIHDVAMNELLLDNYRDALKGEYAMPLLRQKGCNGQTKITGNKIYEMITRILGQLIYGKAKLGLGNAATSPQQQTETELDRFIKELEQ